MSERCDLSPRPQNQIRSQTQSLLSEAQISLKQAIVRHCPQALQIFIPACPQRPCDRLRITALEKRNYPDCSVAITNF